MSPQVAEQLQREMLTAPALAPVNPTSLEKPAFLMSCPFSYSTDVANNAWMQEMNPADRKVDARKAFRQFAELYHFLSAEALLYLLPASGRCGLQDLVFTANLGVIPSHMEDRNTAILSNFSSEPRRGETQLGARFFELMGYNVFVAPHRFEGEAELKHLYDNVYIGGYGIRSDRAAYEWMERQFNMNIVTLEEVDEYLYHVDTTVFPLTVEKTLVCTEMYSPEEVAAIEEHTEIIDVAADHCYSGICNSLRLGNTILNGSHIHDLKAGTDEYAEELSKNRRMEDIATNHGFEVCFFNLSEYLKGGALLSCMVMHLNRHSYSFKLL